MKNHCTVLTTPLCGILRRNFGSVAPLRAQNCSLPPTKWSIQPGTSIFQTHSRLVDGLIGRDGPFLLTLNNGKRARKPLVRRNWQRILPGSCIFCRFPVRGKWDGGYPIVISPRPYKASFKKVFVGEAIAG